MNLLHFDLSNTCLNENIIRGIGISLGKAPCLVSLHLCGNPGVTQQVKDFIFKKIKCFKHKTHETE